jgi:NaMN:DMB phosphoribosyltransferase
MIMMLDNFNAAAAALLAERIYPGTARMMIATAGMDTTGYQPALGALKLKPIPIQPHALPDMLDSIQKCLAD